MAIYNTTILFGGLELEITRMSISKEQRTIKQRIGRTVSQINIIGRTDYQWGLTIEGVITGDDLLDKRTALLELDDGQGYVLIDGYHDGTYYIEPGSLQFADVGGENLNMFRYNMTIIEV